MTSEVHRIHHSTDLRWTSDQPHAFYESVSVFWVYSRPSKKVPHLD